ncbi:efflux RND transporter periplasmic adaptor subunit [Pseudooceanicola sp. 216_PA32_1]|uniref:Efflux RND transporter periplasmic adaptor subunit n=1 Tax=Pseudooceanicola pacificus TaxID=2676438 RepID=A0A844WE57_9RHOB|nr:efflux RND transporter periplasmic adaptor subunit [Pseudooceanicola pacificus]MWB78822.1 efflux RND transporter periplasmic adaptor subunit [Pseudooceanicola pacificus]
MRSVRRAGLILAILPLSALPHGAAALDIRSCTVAPSQVIDVAVEIPGLIAEISVDRGSTVKAGDVLLRLRDSSIRSQVALAKRRAEDDTQIAGVEKRIEVIEGQLERVRSLFQRNLIAQREVDGVEADLIALYQERDRLTIEKDMAAIELLRVQDMMAQRTIRSPIDGLVTDRSADPGEYASEQKPVMTIAALDPLHVGIYVPQSVAGQLKIGDEVPIYLDTAPDTALMARVDVIDRVFDAASGTFGVRLVLPNPDGSLPAGIRCRAQL